MKDLRFAKFVLVVNGLVPGALLFWDAYHHRAGANPVNYAIRTVGLLTLIFLTLTMLVTPLRKITRLNWLFHFRRPLGLLAFSYAVTHFTIFFVFDRALSVRSTLNEMVKRPYLIVGSIGLFAMAPLAATSTNYMIKRMGPKRWQALHRLAYVAAIAGVVHFYMQVKSDHRLPIAFGSVMAMLLGYRLATLLQRRLVERGRQPARVPVEASTSAGRWSGQMRVRRIVQETPDVRTFRLIPAAGGALPFSHLPGQFLTLSVQIGGKTVRRSYTIASSPTNPGYCEITTKREDLGLVSRHMHDTVQEGDLLGISAPAGKFTFTGEDATRVALVAGGVGITPLMSILRYLVEHKWSGEVYLVYSNKTERDIIFREEIESIQRRFPNLHSTLTLTRANGTEWAGATGRIDAELLSRVIPDVTNIPFYVCGPADMLASAREILRGLGVAEQDIRMESFGPRRLNDANASAAMIDGAGFTVTFSRAGKEAAIDGSRPILDLADELEVGVESECRSGICGTCKCRLVSGSVSMETQDALDDADRRANFILLCQARALEDVTIDA